MMHELARLGFARLTPTSSGAPAGLRTRRYGDELTASSDYLRPSFFVNTPDILHSSLQNGGPGMFADPGGAGRDHVAELGNVFRVELFEDRAVAAGSEEYLDSRNTGCVPGTTTPRWPKGRRVDCNR